MSASQARARVKRGRWDVGLASEGKGQERSLGCRLQAFPLSFVSLQTSPEQNMRRQRQWKTIFQLLQDGQTSKIETKPSGSTAVFFAQNPYRIRKIPTDTLPQAS
jgi:hypothetical protein